MLRHHMNLSVMNEDQSVDSIDTESNEYSIESIDHNINSSRYSE